MTTVEKIGGFVEGKGLEAAAREVDVVTTAAFGAMCSSGCFLNEVAAGHPMPNRLANHKQGSGAASKAAG
jgi:uncharacterized protein (DUF39 family)